MISMRSDSKQMRRTGKSRRPHIQGHAWPLRPHYPAADILSGLGIGLLAVFLCYRSIFFLPLSFLFVPLHVRSRRLEREKNLAAERRIEFKNIMAMLYSVTSAGGTLEKAVRDSLSEMRRSPDRFPVMIPEFELVCRLLDNNVPMERALGEFGRRSGDEDIRSFVQILAIAGRSGGSVAQIIRNTSEAVSMRMEMSSEIDTILAGKKAQLKVMTAVPVFILLYMDLCSPEYMQVLYADIRGHIIMSAALAAYLGAVFLGRKILDIQV